LLLVMPGDPGSACKLKEKQYLIGGALIASRGEVQEYEMPEEVRVDPARTALIVVDMQNDFVREGDALVVPDAEEAIPEI
jgi:hypothetical protein